jgi:hypothetical protein
LRCDRHSRPRGAFVRPGRSRRRSSRQDR